MYNSGIKLTHNFRFSFPSMGRDKEIFPPRFIAKLRKSPNRMRLTAMVEPRECRRIQNSTLLGLRRVNVDGKPSLFHLISLISSISKTCDRRRASSGLTPRSSPYARSPSMRCSVEGDGKPRKRSTNLRVRQRLACETPTSRSSNRWRRRHSPEETCTRSSASKHSAQQYSTRQSDQRPKQGRASVGRREVDRNKTGNGNAYSRGEGFASEA